MSTRMIAIRRLGSLAFRSPETQHQCSSCWRWTGLNNGSIHAHRRFYLSQTPSSYNHVISGHNFIGRSPHGSSHFRSPSIGCSPILSGTSLSATRLSASYLSELGFQTRCLSTSSLLNQSSSQNDSEKKGVKVKKVRPKIKPAGRLFNYIGQKILNIIAGYEEILEKRFPKAFKVYQVFVSGMYCDFKSNLLVPS